MKNVQCALVLVLVLSGVLSMTGCSGGTHLSKPEALAHQRKKDKMDGGSNRKATVDQN